MKKLLLLAFSTTLFTAIFGASTVADQFESFIKMEKGHKDDWFNFIRTEADEKFKLLKNHHDQWADFKIELIKALGARKEFSNAELTKAINLHKAQNENWKNLDIKMQKQKVEIAKKHNKELEQFENELTTK